MCHSCMYFYWCGRLRCWLRFQHDRILITSAMHDLPVAECSCLALSVSIWEGGVNASSCSPYTSWHTQQLMDCCFLLWLWLWGSVCDQISSCVCEVLRLFRDAWKESFGYVCVCHVTVSSLASVMVGILCMDAELP